MGMEGLEQERPSDTEQIPCPLCIGAFQAIHRLALFTEAGVDIREVIRRDISLLRKPLQLS
jgi:hypothetical protein